MTEAAPERAEGFQGSPAVTADRVVIGNNDGKLRALDRATRPEALRPAAVQE